MLETHPTSKIRMQLQPSTELIKIIKLKLIRVPPIKSKRMIIYTGIKLWWASSIAKPIVLATVWRKIRSRDIWENWIIENKAWRKGLLWILINLVLEAKPTIAKAKILEDMPAKRLKMIYFCSQNNRPPRDIQRI